MVGYDRFEGERAYRQLAELYRAVRLYVNFFQPSMKLRTKTRTGSRVRRVYGPAQTPFQRVLSSNTLGAASERRLKAVYRALDPVRLLNQLESLQEALWRHALFQSRGRSPITDLVARFDLSACGSAGDEATAETIVRLRADGTPKRKYRRTEKSKGPRLYRSRKDPFEAVWDEVCAWLTARPERNGRSIFNELQQRYPSQFADGQLRTLQRHIAMWRAKTVLVFDDGVMDDVEQVALASLPRPLRVAVDGMPCFNVHNIHTSIPASGRIDAGAGAFGSIAALGSDRDFRDELRDCFVSLPASHASAVQRGRSV